MLWADYHIMFTTKCEVKGCGKEFSHASQTKADHALRMHIGRKHSGTVKDQPKGKATRTYNRKVKVEAITVNFCCNCGSDIHRMAVGMALAAKLKA